MLEVALRRLRPLLGWFVLACGGTQTPEPRLAEPPEPVEWRPFSAEAFAEARRTGRLVLVDVGIEGCTACRWMHEDTYADPEVVAFLRRHFVATSVDADVRPDLGSRWAPWGWPATIFLTAAGHRIEAVRGNRRPRRFIDILNDVLAKAGRPSASPPGVEGNPPARGHTEPLEQLCHAAARRSWALRRPEHGGFGAGIQHVSAHPLTYLFLRAATRDDERLARHALRTVEGFARLIDPVWGGVFVTARNPDWSEPIVEKRANDQAAALTAFALAYRHTGDPRWRRAAQDVHRYLRDFLRTPTGLYYSTQRDRAPELPPGMTPSEYYELTDAERRSHGVPPIDHAVYSDQVARIAIGYASLHRATGDEFALAAARGAVDSLFAERRHPRGWILQTSSDGPRDGDRRMRAFRPDERMYLRPQGPFGSALLALFDATGERAYLDRAVAIARAIRERLEDREHGGFVAVADPRSSFEAFVPRRENLEAAYFFAELSARRRHHSDEARGYRESALRAVQRLIREYGSLENWDSLVGAAARVLDALALGPVEVAISGTSDTPQARELLSVAAETTNPRIVAGYDVDGAYPRDDNPVAAFVCTDIACSSPIHRPAALRSAIAEATTVGDDPCPLDAPSQRQSLVVVTDGEETSPR